MVLTTRKRVFLNKFLKGDERHDGKVQKFDSASRDTRVMLMGKACSLVCAKGTNSSLEYVLQRATVEFSSVFMQSIKEPDRGRRRAETLHGL